MELDIGIVEAYRLPNFASCRLSIWHGRVLDHDGLSGRHRERSRNWWCLCLAETHQAWLAACLTKDSWLKMLAFRTFVGTIHQNPSCIRENVTRRFLHLRALKQICGGWAQNLWTSSPPKLHSRFTQQFIGGEQEHAMKQKLRFMTMHILWSCWLHMLHILEIRTHFAVRWWSEHLQMLTCPA